MWLLFGFVFASAPLAAHDFSITATTLELDRSGRFRAELICDLDALLLGWAPGHEPAELVRAVEDLGRPDRESRLERLERIFLRRVRVRVAGQKIPFEVSFPDRDERPETLEDPPSVLGVTARLEGLLPADAEEVTFWASRAFSAVRLDVLYTGDGSQFAGGSQVLGVGEESAPVPLAPTEEMLRRQRSWFTVGWDYVGLGVVHIVPRGLDHILFVICLVLLRLKTRELLVQVTCFTVAHTVTLAMASMGWVTLPARIVEPVIALSIVYVALENLWTEDVGRARLAVVFVFGLIHGVGFAGVLGELGLPSDQFVPALLGFNLGVEIGQLLVVAAASAALYWFREFPWYRQRVVAPICVVIAMVGLAMAVERVL